MKSSSPRFSIRVQPRASRQGIAGIREDTLKVTLNSPPENGRANAELVKFLASELHCVRSDIKIVSGETSRNKVIEISNPEAALRMGQLIASARGLGNARKTP